MSKQDAPEGAATPEAAPPTLASLKGLLSRSLDSTVAGHKVLLHAPSTNDISDLVAYRRQSIVRTQNLMIDVEKASAEDRQRLWVDAELVALEFEITAKALLLTLDEAHEIETEPEARQFILLSGGMGSDVCRKALALCGFGPPVSVEHQAEASEADRPT